MNKGNLPCYRRCRRTVWWRKPRRTAPRSHPCRTRKSAFRILIQALVKERLPSATYHVSILGLSGLERHIFPQGDENVEDIGQQIGADDEDQQPSGRPNFALERSDIKNKRMKKVTYRH